MEGQSFSLKLEHDRGNILFMLPHKAERRLTIFLATGSCTVLPSEECLPPVKDD